MRFMRLLLVIFAVSVSLVFLQSRSAYAAFHCMRIHAVMAGFNSDSTMQYVELRMSAAGQQFVSGHQIKFYDAAGTLKAAFTFPGTVANSAAGESILIATQEFNDNTIGGNADFTFTNDTVGSNGGDPLHPVQSPAGKVTFAEGPTTCVLGGPSVVDSVAYGSFTGTVDYGSPATALPSPSDNRALRLGNLNLEASNNSTEYSLNAVATSSFTVTSGNLSTDFSTPRNNARTVLQLTSPVGGIAELPDVAGAPLQQPDAGGASATLLAAVIAAATAGMFTLAGAAWYARRRLFG